MLGNSLLLHTLEYLNVHWLIHCDNPDSLRFSNCLICDSPYVVNIKLVSIRCSHGSTDLSLFIRNLSFWLQAFAYQSFTLLHYLVFSVFGLLELSFNILSGKFGNRRAFEICRICSEYVLRVVELVIRGNHLDIWESRFARSMWSHTL